MRGSASQHQIKTQWSAYTREEARLQGGLAYAGAPVPVPVPVGLDPDHEQRQPVSTQSRRRRSSSNQSAQSSHKQRRISILPARRADCTELDPTAYVHICTRLPWLNPSHQLCKANRRITNAARAAPRTVHSLWSPDTLHRQTS